MSKADQIRKKPLSRKILAGKDSLGLAGMGAHPLERKGHLLAKCIQNKAGNGINARERPLTRSARWVPCPTGPPALRPARLEKAWREQRSGHVLAQTIRASFWR